MGYTLRIVNGQLDLDTTTGQLNTVTGERKCSQDLAEVMLQDYDAETNYGSYLTTVVTNSTAVPFADDLFVRHYISEAVDLLKASQVADQTSTSDERIQDILQLLTQFDTNTGTVGFLLSVSTEAGSSDVAIVNIPTQTQPTQLNQLYENIS